MKFQFNDNSKYEHRGDNIEGDKIVMGDLSQNDREKLQECVKETGVSKEDIDNLIKVLKDINISQNDLTTEFAKMAEDQKAAQKKGTMKKLQDSVTLTNGMITLGKTVIGIVTNNPGLAATGVLGLAKEMVE